MRTSTRAIQSAHAQALVHNEAIAYERAAAFYETRGFNRFAMLYLRSARRCYLRWGADGKVRQLDDFSPHLIQDEPETGLKRTMETPVEHFDLAMVMRLSQAISGEIVLEKLIDTLLRMGVEQAGAERGLLIMLRNDEPRVMAEATTRGEVSRSTCATSSDRDYAASVGSPVCAADTGSREPRGCIGRTPVCIRSVHPALQGAVRSLPATNHTGQDDRYALSGK